MNFNELDEAMFIKPEVGKVNTHERTFFVYSEICRDSLCVGLHRLKQWKKLLALAFIFGGGLVKFATHDPRKHNIASFKKRFYHRVSMTATSRNSCWGKQLSLQVTAQ